MADRKPLVLGDEQADGGFDIEELQDEDDLLGGLPRGGTAGQILTKAGPDDYDAAWAAGGVQIAIEDEGAEQSAAVKRINFVGDGVSAAVTGDEATVTIPGASAAGATVYALCRNAVAGTFFAPDTLVFANTTTAGTMLNNRLYLFPFSRKLLADALAIEVSTPSSAVNARAGVYACDAKGRPAALIEEAAPVATMAAAGTKVFALAAPRTLDAPVWLAVIADGLSTMRTGNSSQEAQRSQIMGTSALNTAAFVSLQLDITFGALPATLAGVALTRGTSPIMVALRSA